MGTDRAVEKMAEVEISVVGENLRAKLGEGPHWDTKTQRLFWVDCFDYSVHVLDVETGKVKLFVKKFVDPVTWGSFKKWCSVLLYNLCKVFVCIPLDCIGRTICRISCNKVGMVLEN